MGSVQAAIRAGISLTALMLPSIAAGQTTAGQATGNQSTAAAAQAADATPVPAPVDQPGDATTEGAAPDIVVTGFRGSLQKAAATKRNAAVVSDGLSAEDIGKFPDQNLAESLQHITGVQITRSRGEGSTVNIRGLSANFSRVQFNGRTLAAGGARSFDFATLSPDFISGVEVFKSPTADMQEGGLAGTINVRTARPLDIGRNTATASALGVYELNSKKVTPNFAALGNLVSKDKRFGINVGASYDERKYTEFDYLGYGIEPRSELASGIDYDLDGKLVNGTTAAGKPIPQVYSYDHAQSYIAYPGTRQRYSFITDIQVRPVDWIELYGDLFYSHYNDRSIALQNQTRFTNIGPRRAGDPFGAVASTVDTSFNSALVGVNVDGIGLLPSQGFVSAIDANGVDQRADGARRQEIKSTASGALGVKIGEGPLRVAAEATHTEATLHANSQTFQIISRGSIKTSRPDGYGGLPLVEFTRGYDPANPANYNLVGLNLLKSELEDINSDARIDLTYTLPGSFLNRIKAGGFYGDRHLSYELNTSNPSALQIANLSGGAFPYQSAVEGGSFNAASFLVPYSFRGKIPNLTHDVLVVDPDLFYAKVPLASLLSAVPLAAQRASGYDITERTTALYAMVDFGTGDRGLAGNLGVRWVSTKQTSEGYRPDENGLIVEPGGVTTTVPTSNPVSIKTDYDYFLPSLNLKYDLTERLLVRFAAARALGRATLSQLAAGQVINANVKTITEGNPYLKPYLSDQLDLSLEYYLPGGGLVSIAGFGKRISNFVINGRTARTLLLTQRQDVGLANPPRQSVTFAVISPQNTDKFTIKGVEAGVQLPFTFAPGFWSGFGVTGSFTYLDAPKLPLSQGGPLVPIDSLSKINYTAGAYFEKYGFSLRGTYTYRSKFQGGYTNYFGDFAFTKAFGLFDASTGYDITRSLSVRADISNVLNEKVKAVNNIGLLRAYADTGRRITAGVHVKF